MFEVDEIGITYQIALGRLPDKALEKHLIWLESAFRVATQKRGIQLTVLVGEYSNSIFAKESTFDSLIEKHRDTFKLKKHIFSNEISPSATHNSLARNAKGDFIVIASPEVIPEPTALDNLISRFEEKKDLGLVDARQIPFEFARDVGFAPNATSWCSRSFMMARKSIFDELGGFDEHLFVCDGEDVDFSWRVKLGGYVVNHDPTSIVHDSSFMRSDKSLIQASSKVSFSPLTKLLLPWKWSREDVFESVWNELKNTPSTEGENAMSSFMQIKKTRSLPKQLDRENRVAIFDSPNYTFLDEGHKSGE